MTEKRIVSFYLRNETETPSAYYRLGQYANKLDAIVKIRESMPTFLYRRYLDANNSKIKKNLLQVACYGFAIIRTTYFFLVDVLYSPDKILVSKLFIPRFMPRFMYLILKRILRKTEIIWDFDDNILESGEIDSFQFDFLQKQSKVIIVTNNFLKNIISENYRGKVHLLPTTDGFFSDVDFSLVKNQRLLQFNEQVNLIWLGSATNLIYLKKIIPELDNAAQILQEKTGKKLRLKIVCNDFFDYDCRYLRITEYQWTRGIAKTQLLESHIGLMPLDYSQITLGKGGFKLVQYMATGLPVIASDVGFNREIVTLDSGFLVNDAKDTSGWTESIISLAEDKNNWLQYSQDAKSVWDKNFSFSKNIEFLNNLIRQ